MSSGRAGRDFNFFNKSLFEISERYIRFSLISTVDFYYIINKLIILVSNPH
jgi:hypothetical protein